MSKTPLAKKLRLHTANTALVMNSPVEYFALLDGEVPEEVNYVLQAGAKDVDFVHLFVKNQAELEAHLQPALDAFKYDGLLWISYPKGSSKVDTDLDRDILWEQLKAYDIRPVMMISIDATWSAMRMRPVEVVGK